MIIYFFSFFNLIYLWIHIFIIFYKFIWIWNFFNLIKIFSIPNNSFIFKLNDIFKNSQRPINYWIKKNIYFFFFLTYNNLQNFKSFETKTKFSFIKINKKLYFLYFFYKFYSYTKFKYFQQYYSKFHYFSFFIKLTNSIFFCLLLNHFIFSKKDFLLFFWLKFIYLNLTPIKSLNNWLKIGDVIEILYVKSIYLYLLKLININFIWNYNLNLQKNKLLNLTKYNAFFIFLLKNNLLEMYILNNYEVSFLNLSIYILIQNIKLFFLKLHIFPFLLFFYYKFYLL